jgi:hypothetical protein
MPIDIAPDLQAADWLAAAITAHQFGGPAVNQRITAQVSFTPISEGESLSVLRCLVVPGSMEIQLGRAADPHTYPIHVFLKKVSATDVQVREVVRIRTLIQDAVRSGLFPRSITVAPGNVVVLPEGVAMFDLEADAGWDQDAMSGARIFVARVTVVFKALFDKVPA